MRMLFFNYPPKKKKKINFASSLNNYLNHKPKLCVCVCVHGHMLGIYMLKDDCALSSVSECQFHCNKINFQIIMNGYDHGNELSISS